MGSSDSSDPNIGLVLGGRYPLLERISIGGMGSVYRSRQPMVDRDVAIKIINAHAPGTSVEAVEALQQRFLREARLVASVNHPGIVTLHDFGVEDDGTLFMVMEYLKGQPLNETLAGLPPWRVLAIMLQVLDVLGTAHQRGLVHRDIKPQNIMLLDGPVNPDGSPRCKLLDFGVAKTIDAPGSNLTELGGIVGTPWYMSPEQAQGREDTDHRTDIYSIGVILYEGLSGRPPFHGPSAMSVLTKVCSDPPPPLVPRTPVPPALPLVIAKAMAKDREQRYQDAQSMIAALEAIEWTGAAAALPASQLSTPAPRVYPRTLDSLEAPLEPSGAIDAGRQSLDLDRSLDGDLDLEFIGRPGVSRTFRLLVLMLISFGLGAALWLSGLLNEPVDPGALSRRGAIAARPAPPPRPKAPPLEPRPHDAATIEPDTASPERSVDAAPARAEPSRPRRRAPAPAAPVARQVLPPDVELRRGLRQLSSGNLRRARAILGHLADRPDAIAQTRELAAALRDAKRGKAAAPRAPKPSGRRARPAVGAADAQLSRGLALVERGDLEGARGVLRILAEMPSGVTQMRRLSQALRAAERP